MSTTELVPLPADPSALDAYADPGKFVELACERAKEWLAQALDKGDIDGIVELKSQAEAIRTYTAQKQLGKDAELSAAEIVRRAERGIGLAIRRGQETGEIKRKERHGVRDMNSISPHVVAQTGRTELSEYIYPLADGVPDEQFEEAISEAKAERNLSRANVIRKVKGEPAPPASPLQRIAKAREMAAEGCSSRQIGPAIGVKNMGEFKARHGIEVPADEIVRKTRHHDPNRIVSETVLAVDSAAFALTVVDIDFDGLDPERLEEWVTSLSNSLRSLNRLHKQLKEMTQ